MAKNKYNKFVKSGLAAALVTSAIVPVAAASTPAVAETEVGTVVIEQDGELINISIADYSTLLGAGEAPLVKYITLGNGETFTIEQFGEALGGLLDLGKATEYLANEATPTPAEGAVDGKIEDGKVVIVDDTPEENQNETFFYNLAA